jgi:hypothetical protein
MVASVVKEIWPYTTTLGEKNPNLDYTSQNTGKVPTGGWELKQAHAGRGLRVMIVPKSHTSSSSGNSCRRRSPR